MSERLNEFDKDDHLEMEHLGRIPDDRQALYAELAANDYVSRSIRENPDLPFVSDWNGENPYVSTFLPQLADARLDQLGQLEAYSHIDADEELTSAIADLHRYRYGEGTVTAARCVAGAGSSAFLTTLLMYQHLAGVQEVCYLPPVHSGFAWWIRKLGFGVRRVMSEVDFSRSARLTLPREGGLLWFTDPVWFAGVPVREETIATIAEWQRRTGATVIVDGTFQYMHWNGATAEASEQLDPDRTFRLVCPTKVLMLHGFRFAYAIVPEQDATEFARLHGRLHGPAGVTDRRFAHHAIATLRGEEGARPLMALARERYCDLIASGAVTAAVTPTTGYFLFARPSVPANRFIGMDITCFGGTGHPGYVRINLLNRAAMDCVLDAARPRAVAGGLP
jgi:histidinol-phosphate/aromatic aminotransferase/cobyric acid decarboxylase-like protein